MTDERSPESVVLEAQYWMQSINDFRGMANLISLAANAVVHIPVDAVELMVLTLTLPEGRADTTRRVIERIVEGAREAQSKHEEMIDIVLSALRLAEGRFTSLRAEAGLPPIPDDGERRIEWEGPS